MRGSQPDAVKQTVERGRLQEVLRIKLNL